MDHGRELNNHERAELASRDEEGRTCKLSMHADTIILVYSLTIVLEILSKTDDEVNFKFWKLMFVMHVCPLTRMRKHQCKRHI